MGVVPPVPRVEQLLDVAALLVREREACDEPARLGRVVVLHRGLEVLADRVRLPELATEPAEEAHLGGFDCHMGGAGLEPAGPCLYGAGPPGQRMSKRGPRRERLVEPSHSAPRRAQAAAGAGCGSGRSATCTRTAPANRN